MNDYHHAKDAYLNIVVGNTYYVKFTKDAAWFVRNNPGRTYNLKKMFEKETVRRGDETAWIPGKDGTIKTVKRIMKKNNILFTRKAYEVKGLAAKSIIDIMPVVTNIKIGRASCRERV